ncbi:hypothetical protein PHLGIDRAFT_220645 [Phlebiopsis gigantea 11061_1 CR5-6]|uniref:Uncharacterized protein n=1 Tax=Phlebiopsis gigantea (strain 11061_1 CR5-6) TaxID=745531 RepID=A0A0C3SC45_PHLG1|nr:hypothetical protein PHLGIDRAFT_220645 [Phlebiopsis gigantea 11061_1 CR5-6]
MPRISVTCLLPFVTAPGQSFTPSEVRAFILFTLGLSTQFYCLFLLCLPLPLKSRSMMFSLLPQRSEAPLDIIYPYLPPASVHPL